MLSNCALYILNLENPLAIANVEKIYNMQFNANVHDRLDLMNRLFRVIGHARS